MSTQDRLDEYDRRQIDEAKKKIKDYERIDLNYEGGLFIKTLRDLDFSDEQIRVVIALESILCKSCRDDFSGCQCWNDE